MTELPKIYHSVEVYLFDNKLFVIPQAALPPMLLWCSVEPLIEVAEYESNTLARAIESAKEMSKSRFDPAHTDPSIKPLSGQKKEVHQIWNQSSKQWSLWWTEDGNINFETLVPNKMYRGDMQWKIVSKKIFHQDVSLDDVAKEILSQRVQTPNKEDLPDIPILADSFGYKMAWLVIKNTTPEAIIQKIHFPDVQIVDWDEGINKVYEKYHGRPNNTIFLTPNIRGWILVVGWYLFDLNSYDGKLEKLKERIAELSNVFDEVQAFGTHRVSDYQHWVLAKRGKIIRCFASAGAEIFYNEGKLTEGEKMFPWERLADTKSAQKPWYPDEDDVMTIAGKWSVNPETITVSDIKDKTCYIATVS